MSDVITDGQWREFWAKWKRGQITKAGFQAFLDASGKPNLEGLSETFEVQVDGRTVTCAWIPRNYFPSDPTTQQVMDETARRHLRCPARDVAIAAFDAKKAEMGENPSVAIDGRVQASADGCRVVGCVFEFVLGRYLDLDDLRDSWGRSGRVLVVVSE